MMFLLRSSLSLSAVVAAIISLLLLLGSSSNAVAVNAMSIMDTPLPYSLYAGGDGCTDDTLAGTGTTISFTAIDNEYGSFCEIDEFPVTDPSENESNDNNATTITTTLYSKISISSCHINTTGLIWMETYNCYGDNGCNNCSDVIEFSGFWNLSSYKDNQPLSYTPNQNECFGLQSVTQNSTELEVDDSALSEAMSTGMQLALAENSTTMYQKFEMDSSITKGIEEYWKIFHDYSCMGDGDGSGSDSDQDDATPSSSSLPSLSFADTPLAFTDYGDNNNEPGTDACSVESNVLGSGYVMNLDITDDGCICETDNIVSMSNGTTLQETYYTKWMMYCEPPEEVKGFITDAPTNDVLYSSFQICTKSNCSKESCSSKRFAYTDYWNFVNDPNSCLGWTWYNSNTTGATIMENTTTTEAYFIFTNSTRELLDIYWNFYFDNSCVSTHTFDDKNDDMASSVSSSVSFIDAPMGYTEYGDSNEPSTDGCIESNALSSGSSVTNVDIMKPKSENDDNCFCETDIIIMPDGTHFASHTKIMYYCDPPKEVAGFTDLPENDVLYVTFQVCNTTDCSNNNNGSSSCGDKSIAYVDWNFVEDPAIYGVPGSCMNWKWFINPFGETGDVFAPGMENITNAHFKFTNATSEQLNTYWNFYFDNSCAANHNKNMNDSGDDSGSVATPTTDNDTDGVEPSGSSITTLVMTTWTSMILLFALVAYNN